MKLIQLNVWSGKLSLQVCRFLKQQNADILCLQEVYAGNKELGGMFAEEFALLDSIQTASDLEHTFFSPTWTIDLLGQRVPFGNAILSCFPLEQQATHFIHGQLHHKASPTDSITNTRNLQTARVAIGDRRLSIANHHAYWDISPMGNEVSVEKMHRVRAILEKLPQPLITAGDMNVKSVSPAMHVFDGFLKDLTAVHQVQTTLSSLGKVKDVDCDHILVSPDINVQNFTVSEELVSDHKALILEFEL